VAEFEADTERAKAIVAAARAAGRSRLLEHESLALFEAYGIPVAPYRFVGSVEEAARAGGALGYPVALKIVATEVVHKTDVGGVILGLENEKALRRSFDEIIARAGERGLGLGSGLDGLLVQKMLPGGRETIIGMTYDPGFGPLLMFGLGGIYVEAIGDVAFRIHPVSDLDAAEMVRQVRGFKLLEGVRGERSVDLRCLEETIQRVSGLVAAHPEILELDINPFLAFPPGGPSAAADGRILLRRET
jgi:acyl-CoA synthetase (NDP forming)